MPKQHFYDKKNTVCIIGFIFFWVTTPWKTHQRDTVHVAILFWGGEGGLLLQNRKITDYLPLFFNDDKLVESLMSYPDDKHSYDSEVQNYGFDWLRTNNQ